jgi:hypothetical protein
MPPNPEQRPSLHGQRLWSGFSRISKRSVRSFSTSNFEADDERSSDTESAMSPPNSNGGELPALLYTGQDARPTSSKELLGWYAYAFAAETYVICGIGTGLPTLRIYGTHESSLWRGCVHRRLIRSQALSSQFSSKASPERMAYYFRTRANRADRVTVKAKMTGNASSTCSGWRLTPPVSPCTRSPSASFYKLCS